jgi:hypothetical protein
VFQGRRTVEKGNGGEWSRWLHLWCVVVGGGGWIPASQRMLSKGGGKDQGVEEARGVKQEPQWTASNLPRCENCVAEASLGVEWMTGDLIFLVYSREVKMIDKRAMESRSSFFFSTFSFLAQDDRHVIF